MHEVGNPPLSESQKVHLDALVKMANWFGGYFNRRAHIIIGKASNDR